ncbi:hypothetical protein AB0C15_03380 [Micromonospora sp. NPDC048835]|uniref:hypothetical protein n=1 Tax=Micromonospora sp. NPDC048835 TaxID=3155147 RepID=UPI0034020A61
MSDQDPPPTPAAQLAAIAHDYYAPRPRLADPAYSNLLRRPEVQPFDAVRLGRALAPMFTRGYVQRVTVAEYDTDTVERRTVAQRSAADLVRADYLSADDFAGRVALLVTHLPDATPSTSSGVARAVRDSRALAAFGVRSPWARAVARAVVAELPALDDAGLTLFRDGEPERPAAGWTAEQRREYDRARRVPRDPSIVAAQWVATWRDQTGPGAHPAADVYRAYVASAERAGATPVGRTHFYKLAEAVCGPRKRRASGPVFVVSQEATPMDRKQRRDLAAAIVDRLTVEWRTHALDGLADLLAERQAATATNSAATTPAISGAANVVDLAAHRARRAA